ncbi:MAG: hypothetical protein ACMUJM_02195 [bacterium]
MLSNKWLKSALLIISSFSVLICFTPTCCHHSLHNKNSSPEIEQSFDLEKLPEHIALVLVPENEEWLVASVIPAVGRLRDRGMAPVFVATSDVSFQNHLDFIDYIGAHQTLIIASSPENSLIKMMPYFHYPFLRTGSDPAHAGILLMKTFWESNEDVVIASFEEPACMVLGSLLAAHLSIPFISYQNNEVLKTLFHNLSAAGVKRIRYCTNVPPAWMEAEKNLFHEVVCLPEQHIVQTLIDKIHPENIRNIIIARKPDIGEIKQYTASWIAPYLSLLRDSLVLISTTHKPSEIETLVAGHIEQYSLNPQTITLLGDHDTLGEWILYDEGIYDDEKIDIEPCSFDIYKKCSLFGVGRIPFNHLADASSLIAHTYLNEQHTEKSAASILMISNPDTEFANLSLCETISRLTAAEFKNCTIPIAEFYGKEAEDPEIVDVATKAQLIIFEGHIWDMTLFEHPIDPVYVQEDRGASMRDYCETSVREDCFQDEDPEGPIIPSLNNRNLEGHPLVILQSCHSLREKEVPHRIFNLGGSGVIGSVSSIHSASGASFIKAFCDGLLYHDNTVGEALRDARNYCLCLAKLKEKRGHTEQDKVLRVAYSFRLWGDPEMSIQINKAIKLRRQPLTAQWNNLKEIKISTPHRTLPKIESEYYYAQMFPGSQAAGIVKSIRNNPEQRKIQPLFFFRLPNPLGLELTGTSLLKDQEGEIERAVFLEDPLNRYLYILYYPFKTSPDYDFFLRFENS